MREIDRRMCRRNKKAKRLTYTKTEYKQFWYMYENILYHGVSPMRFLCIIEAEKLIFKSKC